MFTPKMIVAVRVMAKLQSIRSPELDEPILEWTGHYLDSVHGLRDNTLRALYRRGVLARRTYRGRPMWSLAPKTAAIIDAVRA